MSAINSLLRSAIDGASGLSASNDKKLSELSEALFTSLRDTLDGEDLAGLNMDDDQLAALQAIMLRLSLIGRARDMSSEMTDEQGGQTSAWDIALGMAERGKLGYKEEDKVRHIYSNEIVHRSLPVARQLCDPDCLRADCLDVQKLYRGQRPGG